MSTEPPLGTRTRAAALASRRAKSTVIGACPTLPRTPSVPKYFLLKGQFSDEIQRMMLAERRAGNADGIHGFRHIMRPDDPGSVQDSNGRQRHTPRQAARDGPAGELADH